MSSSEYSHRSQPLNGSNGQLSKPMLVAASQPGCTETAPSKMVAPASEMASNRFLQLLYTHPGFLLGAALFRAIRKRPLIAIGTSLLLTVLALSIVWYIMPPYALMARALLRFDLVPSGFFDSPQNQYYLANLATFQKTQQALIRSRPTLSAALKRIAVENLPSLRSKKDLLAYLEREIVADFSTSPEIMRISMTGTDAEDMRIIIDAVASTYLEQVSEKERNQMLGELQRLHELIARQEQKLASKRERLRRLESAAGNAHSVESLFKTYLEQIDRCRKELASQQSVHRQWAVEIETLAPRLALAKMLLAGAVKTPWYVRLGYESLLGVILPASQVELALHQEPIVQEKMRELHRLEAELQAAHTLLASGISTEKRDQLLKSKRDAILEAQAQLESTKQQLRPQVQQRLLQEYVTQNEQRLSELRDKQMQASRLQVQLQDEIQTLEKTLISFQRSRVDIQWLRDEIESDLQVHKKLLARKDQLEMLLSAAPRVTLLEKATVTPVYESKKRWLYTGLVVTLSLLTWLLGLLAWEWHTQRIHSPEELAGKLAVPVIAMLPACKPGSPPLRSIGDASQGLLRERSERFIEAVDTLRALLTERIHGISRIVLMVTSAIHGEGKTTVSCHLAASLARTGRRVLLLDADLCHGNAHRLLGGRACPGVAEIVHGHISWQNAVQPTTVRNLDLIASGNCDHKSMYELSQSNLSNLISSVRHVYDVVILDTPPVLLVPDAMSVARLVDGVLVTVMRKVSSLRDVREVCYRLGVSNAQILGVVMSGGRVRCRKYLGPASYEMSVSTGERIEIARKLASIVEAEN